MSTGVIVAIIVVALIVIALLAFALPRMRRGARIRAQERELQQRRQRAVSAHQEEASASSRRAEAAEQQARIAEQEAARERAEAQLHQERASQHEQGLADHELMPREDDQADPVVADRDADTRSDRSAERAPTADTEVR
jgi:uncharacterized membrane protein YcjF (UPF0283 family)